MEEREETNQSVEAEEQWIEVRRGKKNKEGGNQQPAAVNAGHAGADGKPHGGRGQGQGGRGGNHSQSPREEDEEQKKKWLAIEEELKPKVVVTNDFDWSLNAALAPKNSPETQTPQGSQTPSNSWSKVLFGNRTSHVTQPPAPSTSNKPLSLIGGAHVSYIRNSPKKSDVAVASLVVCSFPSRDVLYEAVKEMPVDTPMISGFHSFRDTQPLVALFEELKATKPEFVPQVIFVDGPGVLYKGFGLATHLGVLLDVPTVGVTKKFFTIDGVKEVAVRKIVTEELQKRGEAVEIVGRSAQVLGAALKIADGPRGNFICVSVGHRIDLPTAVLAVRDSTIGKVPQPLYVAEQKVKQEVQKLDTKPKKPANAGKSGAGNNNRRNSQQGKQGGKKESGNRREGGNNDGGAVTNGKGQGKRRPRGDGPQQGGNTGPKPQGQQGQQGQGQGQGQGRKQGGNKGPRAQQGQGQGQQGQGQQGQGQQGGKRGPRGGNNRSQGNNSPKQGNVWTQKVPAGSPTTAPPAQHTDSQQGSAPSAASAGNQQRSEKQQGQGQGQQKQGGSQKKQPQQQGEKSGEKQQQSAQEASAEKKD